MKLFVLLMSLSFSVFAVDNADVTYEYEIIENKRSDILFIIDNSGSMYNVQKMLADFSATFLNSLGDVDFKITGLSTSRNEEIPENFVFSRDHDADEKLSELILSFGLNGNANEAHFDRIKEFYFSPISYDFFRHQASKEIVIISDEDDENSTTSVMDTITLMESSKTTVSAVAVKDFQNCSVVRMPSKLSNNLLTLVEGTFGNFIDLCEVTSENISERLEELGRAILERSSKSSGRYLPIKRLELPKNVDYGSISINYGTQTLMRGYYHTGWIIDESENTIRFGEDVVLSEQPTGTKLVIKFSLIK